MKLLQCKCGFIQYETLWIDAEWINEGCPKCDGYSYKKLPKLSIKQVPLQPLTEIAEWFANYYSKQVAQKKYT